jgi:hypothetical protein
VHPLQSPDQGAVVPLRGNDDDERDVGLGGQQLGLALIGADNQGLGDEDDAQRRYSQGISLAMLR